MFAAEGSLILLYIALRCSCFCTWRKARATRCSSFDSGAIATSLAYSSLLSRHVTMSTICLFSMPVAIPALKKTDSNGLSNTVYCARTYELRCCCVNGHMCSCISGITIQGVFWLLQLPFCGGRCSLLLAASSFHLRGGRLAEFCQCLDDI